MMNRMWVLMIVLLLGCNEYPSERLKTGNLEPHALHSSGWMKPLRLYLVKSNENFVNDRTVIINNERYPRGTVRLSRFYWEDKDQEGVAVVVSTEMTKGIEKSNIQEDLNEIF